VLKASQRGSKQQEITCCDHSIIACSHHIYGCCSSHTSHSWWISHSTQHQLRGCNTIMWLQKWHLILRNCVSH